MRFPLLTVLPLAAYAAPLTDLTAQDVNEINLARGEGSRSSSSSLGSILKGFSSGFLLDKLFDTVQEVEKDLVGEKDTILDFLEADPNYSKITKLIKMDGLAAEYLDNAANHVTFFAPNNDAFPEHHHDNDGDDDFSIASSRASFETKALSEMLKLDSLDSLKGGDHDDEKKKKIFRKILRGVLQYHMSDHVLESTELIKNSTISTGLRSHQGALLGHQQRIKVTRSLLPIPTIALNEYVKVVKADGKASNGVVHGIDHPLLPPSDIFAEAFLLPKFFSTTTSALQRTHLDEVLTYSTKPGYFAPHASTHTGPSALTAFVPTNGAWSRIPEKLELFLFSPFGTHALKRLLELHVVLDGAFYSEQPVSKDCPGLMDDTDHYHVNATVPSAAKGEDLTLSVRKSESPLGAVEIEYKVNGQEVEVYDVPARNGVIHIVRDVLIPGGRSSWKGWDEGGRDGWFGRFVRGDEGKKHHHHGHHEADE